MSKGFVLALAAGAALLGLLFASLQNPFALASFDYGVSMTRLGVVELSPLPVLNQGGKLTPLVAQGKFGAEKLLAAMEGQKVEMVTSAIRRDSQEMWEVSRASRLGSAEDGVRAEWKLVAAKAWFSGEIVDSKCWLGVMQPGAGRVHRECAFRCLRGGVPSMFIAKDGMAYWMLDEQYQRLDPRLVAEWVALRIRLQGRIVERANLRFLAVDANSMARE